MKKIICLYGGPGSGKSTTCAGLYAFLKMMGVDAEMNREYVKNWVWEKRKINPGDQTYFFAKMAKVERSLMSSNVEVIITDSPLILTHYYGLIYDPLEKISNTSLMLLQHHHKTCQYYGYKVEHYFIGRGDRPYNPNGRFQTLEEAKDIDTDLRLFLNKIGIRYKDIRHDGENTTKEILKDILSKQQTDSRR